MANTCVATQNFGLTSTISDRSLNRRSSWSICRFNSLIFSWRPGNGRSASCWMVRSNVLNVSKLASSFLIPFRVVYNRRNASVLGERKRCRGDLLESSRLLLWCFSRLVCSRSYGFHCLLWRTIRELENILYGIYADDVRHCPVEFSWQIPNEDMGNERGCGGEIPVILSLRDCCT